MKNIEADLKQRNVFGQPILPCSVDPVTGFFRDGCCHTGPEDAGSHTVCAVMTQDFLLFTREQGNDLSSPRPEFGFPGLKPGDQWCLCAARWKEAYDVGKAPKVALMSTHEQALEICDLSALKEYAVDLL